MTALTDRTGRGVDSPPASRSALLPIEPSPVWWYTAFAHLKWLHKDESRRRGREYAERGKICPRCWRMAGRRT